MEKLRSKNNLQHLVRFGLTLSALLAALATEKISGDRREDEARMAALLALGQRIEISLGEAGKFLETAPATVGAQLIEVEARFTAVITEVSAQMEDLISSRYFGPVKLEQGKRLDFEKTVEIYKYAVTQWKKLPPYTARPTIEQIEKAEHDLYAAIVANDFAPADSKYIPGKWSWFEWEEHLSIFAKTTNCKPNAKAPIGIELNSVYDPRIGGVQYPQGNDYQWPKLLSTLGVHNGCPTAAT